MNEENNEEEDTQTIQELIAQLSSNPNKSEAEESKIAGLLKAQNKMFELGVTTKEAIKLVPELWKFWENPEIYFFSSVYV